MREEGKEGQAAGPRMRAVATGAALPEVRGDPAGPSAARQRARRAQEFTRTRRGGVPGGLLSGSGDSRRCTLARGRRTVAA
ncbi:hypothetical protein OG302_39545 [Streptomyces sp. NBC_01283]|uniref:hypothetical protein n=1 Tax=Streptomyces sp. NBC_01283 TaxID=2903812 RepID=UPI00352BE686|nr:hypothetical protein OG302_39545 [Streptomyces sp. NBC_01283]